MHHETSGSATNYERRKDTAYRFMNGRLHGRENGLRGPHHPRGEHHDGQWMVNHYVRVAEKRPTPYYGRHARARAPHRPGPHLPQLAGLRGGPWQRIQRL